MRCGVSGQHGGGMDGEISAFLTPAFLSKAQTSAAEPNAGLL